MPVRIQLLWTLVLTLAADLNAANPPVVSPSKPNILYFYVDDMGWGAIAPNGQAERKAKGLPHLITPNLDRLAAAGVNFRRSYGCTVCSPARSSQQTGFHQGHTFADRNDPNNAKKAIRAEDLTMGDMLSKAGYTTGYWGKWGYGGSKSQPNPTIDNIQTLPTSHGYQHVVAELHHVRAHTFFQPTLWNAPAAPGAVGGLELKPNSMQPYLGNQKYPNQPALQNHPDYPKTAYCDDVYAFAALDFVRTNAQNYNATGKPFFGLLAVQVPHAPFGEIEDLPEWDRDYRNKPFFSQLSDQARQWAAMITRIDGHFGNILAALEDPNDDGDKSDSVANDTLVIFQSDNGGPRHPARNEFMANANLRENKGSIYEGGIRIPTLMRWPGKIKAGTQSDQVIDVTDLLPTFCELAGVQAPLGIDGVSLAPTLSGKGRQRKREFLIHEAGKGQSIIRGRHKLIRLRKAFELYDLEADPSESNDILGDNEKLAEELKAIMLAEHVAEPKGFANTYHRWIGKNRGKTSDSDNWSNYTYANADITYMTDDGAPRSSWIGLIENSDNRKQTAMVDKDLELLALEIRGQQSVLLRKGVRVDGRNAIRLSPGADLRVGGGLVSSQRGIDVAPKANLRGPGVIKSSVRNAGLLESAQGPLQIRGELHSTPKSKTHIWLAGDVPLSVTGTAHLDGNLLANVPKETRVDQPIVLIRANKIEGRFRTTMVSQAKKRLRVVYTSTEVQLHAR